MRSYKFFSTYQEAAQWQSLYGDGVSQIQQVITLQGTVWRVVDTRPVQQQFSTWTIRGFESMKKLHESS